MMGNFGLLALALTITPVQETTDRNLFQLFNNCEPMSLAVEVSGDDEDSRGPGDPCGTWAGSMGAQSVLAVIAPPCAVHI